MNMERVDENTREVDTGTVKYTIKRRTEVDLWDIYPSKGPAPRGLDGAYTTANHAHASIVNYVATKKKD